MNRDPVEHFWFPDIFIDKAKLVRKPTYEIAPAYLRIYPSGRFLYSARVNYDISCPMDFKFYPVSSKNMQKNCSKRKFYFPRVRALIIK